MIRRSVRSMLMVAPLVLASLAGTSLAAPPTDEQIETANKAMSDAVRALRKEKPSYEPSDLKPLAEKALEGLSIDMNELSLDHMKKISRLLGAAGREAEVKTRLGTLAEDKSDQGAGAAIMMLDFLGQEPSTEQVAAALKVALDHPGTPALIREGKAMGLFYNIERDPEALKQLAEPVLALGDMVNGEMTAKGISAMPAYFGAIVPLREAHADRVEKIRTSIIAAMDKAMPGADEPMQDRLKKQRAVIDGADARGTLLGSAAPAMNIAWSSDPAIKSFADLKGKVVVVDFWATWCGPCIASFPNMREMQKHYEGYPVTIVGVTSLQGSHSGPDGRVSTEGDPQKEYTLMAEFMKQKEMSWPVIFTEQEVFNPDFGVQGIPHVAIIDPSGKVRFNGLHPMDPAEKKYSKIDALLKEANLPAPVGG